jgi:hypothetical protein
VFKLVARTPGEFVAINEIPKASDWGDAKRLKEVLDSLRAFNRKEFQLVQVLLVDARACPRLTVLCRPRLGGDAIQRQVGGNLGGRADGQHFLEDAPHHRRLGVVDDQQTVLDVEAERRHAPHPHPLALAGGDLVADALAGDLALELGEGQQHVEHQSSH